MRGRDVARRIRAAERQTKGGAVPITSERTGRVIGYIDGRDAVTILMRWLDEQDNPADADPPITEHPLWTRLAEAAPFGSDVGAIFETIRRAAHEWRESGVNE